MSRDSRPRDHVVAPRGWMNDPCGPGYDPVSKLYYLFYQWNPDSAEWGNITWGGMTSRDMLTWRHISEEPILRPGETYDRAGIFSGCFHADKDRGELVCFYTSVNELPIHWTKNHIRGSESLSVATSRDAGRSWQKQRANPIIDREPESLVVTGYRDPFVSGWPSMDTARTSTAPGSSSKGVSTLYGLLSGGIKTEGPQTFLYSVDPSDVKSWTFIGPLIAGQLADQEPSGRWGGNLGWNWECTSFATVRTDDNRYQRELVMPSSEGCTESAQSKAYRDLHPEHPSRTSRCANWFFGTIHPAEHPTISVDTLGLLDWGILYACTVFTDPNGRLIMWGWAGEEDVPSDFLKERGWTGCLGLPREIFLFSLEGVTGTVASALLDVKNIQLLDQPDGTSHVLTLGIRPLTDIRQLRAEKLYCINKDCDLVASEGLTILKQSPPAIEIVLDVSLPSDTKIVLSVKADYSLGLQTDIVYDTHTETICVQRDRSTSEEGFNVIDDIGSHTLFRTSSGLEPLQLRIFIDQDLIEIFANERFALTTRTYSPSSASGISLLATGKAVVNRLEIWELGDIGL